MNRQTYWPRVATFHNRLDRETLVQLHIGNKPELYTDILSVMRSRTDTTHQRKPLTVSIYRFDS